MYDPLRPPATSFGQMDPGRRETPADIVRQVGQILQQSDLYRTLAHLQQCSRLAYDVINPILYTQVILSGNTCADLLNIGDVSDVPVESFKRMQMRVGYWDVFENENDSGQVEKAGDGQDNREEESRGEEEQWSKVSEATFRRLASFQHTKRLIIRSLPPDHISTSFFTACTILFGRNTLLFPRLSSISLLADAVDALRVWAPDQWDRPRNPTFLESLAIGASPTNLCISFRLVMSTQWEEHRDLTLTGMYQLTSRVTRLGESWPLTLKTFNVHDIVHQVLPSVRGCQNNYHFSSHVISHPSFPTRYRFPFGEASVGLPGPEWNIRPWQIGGTIKNLFPSGGDHTFALDGTSWVFINVTGHLLTKAQSDDDDGTGVGLDEVDALVKDSVKVGVRRDLPQREGFGEHRLTEVFERIKYVQGGLHPCEGCGRCGPETGRVLVSDVSHVL